MTRAGPKKRVATRGRCLGVNKAFFLLSHGGGGDRELVRAVDLATGILPVLFHHKCLNWTFSHTHRNSFQASVKKDNKKPYQELESSKTVLEFLASGQYRIKDISSPGKDNN